MSPTRRWLLLLLCVTACTGRLAPLAAQTKATEEAAPNPLPGLPRPPDQPANLYAPPPPHPYEDGDPMPPRYFEVDPLVDPPGLLPGWVSSVEVSLTKPVVVSNINNFVTVGARAPGLVTLPVHALDAALMPRLEVGYRLPTGFGEISLAYRGLATSGSSTTLGPDTFAPLRSRLDFNIIDLDYVSREWALGPCWRMDWRFGVRLVYLYLDAVDNQPLAAAAAGSGILTQQITNFHWGVGPHCGLELSRHLPGGFDLVANTEVTGLMGRIKQGFAETALDVNGVPNFGGQTVTSSQPLAMFSTRLGVGWQPPHLHCLQLFAGYQLDYWWEVGRLGTITSTGSLWDQGVVVRAQIAW